MSENVCVRVCVPRSMHGSVVGERGERPDRALVRILHVHLEG